MNDSVEAEDGQIIPKKEDSMRQINSGRASNYADDEYVSSDS